ncbi:sugar-binding domain-containing protein [Paracoccus beibuensis]|uniref:sugar-binding domain-containing protein n=1 Tax=Paracoccus beibuensis TaxID=547602 RepID=UPI003898E61C
MITSQELAEVRACGAVGDTNALFYDAAGAKVDHPLNRCTIGLGFDDLRKISTVAIVAGRSKIYAVIGFLKSDIVRGLILTETQLSTCPTQFDTQPFYRKPSRRAHHGAGKAQPLGASRRRLARRASDSDRWY